MLKLKLDGAIQSREGLSSVHASVAGGRVTLAGVVHAEHLKSYAEEVCRRAGVTGRIVNLIEFRGP